MVKPPADGVQTRGPVFGRPPPGTPDPTRFSLPAFLPPAEMKVDQIAANDLDPLEAMDVAFSSYRVPELEPATEARVRSVLIFAAGVAAGVIATLLLS